MTIRVHIDRVVIDAGVAPSGASGFGEALHAELGRLLTATPTLAWGESRRVRMLRADAPSPGAGEPLATTLAQALHRALVEGAR